ncbi:diguanylate cyclase [Myxococcota bacterium]|nr:diguanylate cyclase [Myxococcota bacterium]
MEEFNDRLARVARDTMMELMSRGVPALPGHYRQVFVELCEKRGIPVSALDGAQPDPPAAAPPLDRDLVSLLLSLAELAGQSLPAQTGIRSVVDLVQTLTASGGDLDRATLATLLQRLDRLNVELQASPPAPAPAPGLERVLERLSEVLRLLVPLADPEGADKEAALGALSALSQARRADDVLPALDALSLFAVGRRKAIGAELLATKQTQRRSAELLALGQTVLDFVGRVLPDLPEIESVLSHAKERLGTADPRGVQEIRIELSSHFQRVQGATVPVQEQKTVIKGVLRTLADQLAQASAGSEQFEKSAQEIRRRLESANDLTELRQLQDLLVREAGTAASEASRMRSQLGDLSTQVSTSQQQIDTLERALVETRQAMNLDPLTRVPNRRAMTDWVDSTLYPPGRPERGYSLLVLDLDHFKKVNDTHGHLAGDAVLAETAKRVKLGIRDMDMLARYGGEEFVLVLPDCDLHIARAVADRMCALVARKPVSHENVPIPVTTSIGVATKRPGEGFKEVFERADQCVYQAKQTGRNRAVTELSLPAPEAG